MSRSQAYISALKYHFGNLVICDGKAPRDAYKAARYLAATYAFRIKSEKL